jgi:hypothetical protein
LVDDTKLQHRAGQLASILIIFFRGGVLFNGHRYPTSIFKHQGITPNDLSKGLDTSDLSKNDGTGKSGEQDSKKGFKSC